MAHLRVVQPPPLEGVLKVVTFVEKLGLDPALPLAEVKIAQPALVLVENPEQHPDRHFLFQPRDLHVELFLGMLLHLGLGALPTRERGRKLVRLAILVHSGDLGLLCVVFEVRDRDAVAFGVLDHVPFLRAVAAGLFVLLAKTWQSSGC